MSVNNILRALRGTKALDLFQSGRVDQNVPIEQAICTLKRFVDEGKIGYIGMSECKAETIRRAAAVAPIAVVEIEVSPISYEEETKKGQYLSAIFITLLRIEASYSHRSM